MAEMVNPLYIFYHSKIFLKDEKKKKYKQHTIFQTWPIYSENSNFSLAKSIQGQSLG